MADKVITSLARPRAAIGNLLRWIDYLLAGPPPPPRACEYRRPARITYRQHGGAR